MLWPNNWKIRDCLLLCCGLTVTQAVLTVMAASILDVPILRQVVGFIFLTFIPGILLLRILRVHDINAVESMAYSVGLSITLVMLSGAAINFLLPPFAIKHPISQYPILITLVIEIALLMTAAWYRDRNYLNRPEERQRKPAIDINSVLFLILVLVLMIAGIKISDLTGNNWIIIVSLLAMALIAVLASFRRFITPAVYPPALFVISLGLLYQTSLMSPYLVGTDIYTEYNHFASTISSGLWDYTITNPVNSCLSIVILAPSYSFMMGVDGVWIFKSVYPILFSLMPLVMFRFMRIQIGALPAFLAVFFFMAVPTFSLEMVGLCRQQIAELFFSFLVLLLVDRRIGGLPRALMMLMFVMSIIVSHYSLSFITLLYVILLAPAVLLLKSGYFIRFWSWITSWSGGLPEEYKQPGAGALPVIFTVIPILTYATLGLAWYLLVGQGINYSILSMMWTTQSGSIGSSSPVTQDLLVQAALGMDFFKVSWQGQLFRLLQYITQLFIIAGCLRLLLMPKGLKFRTEYVAVSAVSVALLAACIRLPNFAYAFNTTRWYHILLITLAPFFIIGGQTVLGLFRYAWLWMRKSSLTALKDSPVYLEIIAAAVLAPYFLITSGIIYEVTGMQDSSRLEAPFSIALSSHRLDLVGNFSPPDDYASLWLASACTGASSAYSDTHTWKVLVRHEFPGAILSLAPTIKPGDGDLLFLTDWNVSHDELTFTLAYPGLRNHTGLSEFVNGDADNSWKERIYTNGFAEILRAHP